MRWPHGAGSGAIVAVAVSALGASALVAGSASAQSLVSVGGLGYPLQAVDARTATLDGLGVGLQGFSLPLTNPASPARVLRRGFVFAVENNERVMTLGDESGETGATRFPLLRLVFPVGDVVLTMGYGGVLDQSWGVVREGSVVLGSDELAFTDRTESTGGVGQFQVGAALPLGERFAVGATVGALTGSQRVRRTRLFDATGPLEPFDETDGWRYTGPTAAVGATWDPIQELRVGASVSWMGSVSVDSVDGRARDRSFEGPFQVAAGASGYLAPTMLASVSGRWSGWGSTAFARADGGSVVQNGRDTWEWGAGLEWDDPESRANRSYPIRAGFQYRQLPFAFGSETPTEWFAGLGLGMRIGPDIANPLARVDLAVQRGERSAAGDAVTADFEERVWRVALTISLFGN